jgi:spore coat protein U-like protein
VAKFAQLIFLGAALCGFAAPARADCLGAPVIVTLPAVFLLYDPSATSDPTSSGSITLTCLVPIQTLPDFTISLSSGSPGGSFDPRVMTFGGSTLNYNFYTGSDYQTIWGDGSGNTVTQSYTDGGTQKIYTVYAAIPRGQYVTTGLYTGSVTVTITY